MDQITSRLQHNGHLKTVILGLIGAAVAYAVLRVFYELFLSPEKDIPGPFLAKFTRLWLLREVKAGQSQQTFVDLHKEHGPVVRVAPDLYSFSSPEDQKKIYDLKNELLKTHFYDTAGDPRRRNIFNMLNKPDHTDRKKKLSNLYSMSSMQHYEKAVDKMNALVISKFHKFAEEKKKFHVPDFMQCYAFDVIGEITVDSNFGLVENEGDVDDLIALVQGANEYMGHVGIFPEWHNAIVWVGEMFGIPNGGKKIEAIARSAFKKYRDCPLAGKEDALADPFITKLLRLEAAGKIDFPAMMDSIGGNIGAGSDTTAITLSTALYYLYRTPEALKALRKEIDEFAVEGKISDPVTFKEAQQMPYLQAVIAEALRIHPAVGYLLERVVPKGGAELAGRYFPEGTRVGVNAWALHQNPELYGSDVDVFRPERFLSAKTSTSQLGAMFSFGAGSRSCLGKNISLLEMTKVVPQIVRRFDLVFENDEPWELYTSWFVWQKYFCYVEPRKE